MRRLVYAAGLHRDTCRSTAKWKTTAARFLQARGYELISASDVVGRLDGPDKLISGRRELISRGERMLHEQGPEWFAERLLAAADGHPRVVFDGIRPIETIKHIVKLQPNTAVLFIQAREAVRRERYSRDKDSRTVSYDEVLRSEVQRTAEGVHAYARTVNNEGSLEGWILTRSATLSIALLHRQIHRQKSVPVSNPQLPPDFEGKQSAWQEGISSRFNEVGVALRVRIQEAFFKSIMCYIEFHKSS